MGYRSDVRCLIYGSEQDLNAHIEAQIILFSTIAINHFKENLKRYVIKPRTSSELHVLELNGEQWKWYDGYPGVQAWMQFMKSSPDLGLQYEFIRVGEEHGDIEQEYSDDPHYFLGVTTPSIIDQMPEIEREIPLTY